MTKLLYFTVLIIGFCVPAILFLFIYPNSLHFVLFLGIYMFIYKPIADYIYIKNRNFYPNENILKKYPFWSPALLRKMYFE